MNIFKCENNMIKMSEFSHIEIHSESRLSSLYRVLVNRIMI